MDNLENRFVTYQFGDTEFIVPSRYQELSPRGIGAQGTVWYVSFILFCSIEFLPFYSVQKVARLYVMRKTLLLIDFQIVVQVPRPFSCFFNVYFCHFLVFFFPHLRFIVPHMIQLHSKMLPSKNYQDHFKMLHMQREPTGSLN